MKTVVALASLLLILVASAVAQTPSTKQKQKDKYREIVQKTYTTDELVGTVDEWVVPAVRANWVTIAWTGGTADLELDIIIASGCLIHSTELDTVQLYTTARSYIFGGCSDGIDSIGVNTGDLDAGVTYATTITFTD